MPHYDKRRGDLVIRVVYDGAPEAGKTTNVRQLAGMISLKRRGHVISPGRTSRRTEFFDWMDFAGGFIDGQRLRCQVLTVPGQSSLLRRRRYLLDTADVVIFVADSHPLLVEENREAFESLEATLARATDVPVSIVLQANKQDRANAVAPVDLARRMQLSSRVPVIGACAHVGEGVKESFLLAVRLAADRVRALTRRGAVAEGDESTESPLALHERMLRREIEDTAEEADEPLEIAPEATSDACGVEIVIDVDAEPETEAPAEVTRGPGASAPTAALPPDTPSPLDIGRLIASDTVGPEAPAVHPTVFLPDASAIPAGCVWPPMTGRTLYAAAHREDARAAAPPRRWAPTDALELHGARDLLLHTRAGWLWPSLESARFGLLAEIRALLPLGAALPDDRALVVGPDGDAWRLWMISRDHPTLGDELAAALEGRAETDPPALARRCIEAWNVLRQTIDSRADALVPDDVAWGRHGWVVLAIAGPGLRPAPRDLPWQDPLASHLLHALEAAGAWPALRAVLSDAA